MPAERPATIGAASDLARANGMTAEQFDALWPLAEATTMASLTGELRRRQLAEPDYWLPEVMPLFAADLMRRVRAALSGDSQQELFSGTSRTEE